MEDEVRAHPTLERPATRWRPGWKDAACIGPILAHSIYIGPWIGVPIQAVFIGTHPLLLSALRGSLAALVATGAFARVGRGSLPLALLAPLPVLMFADPFYFWAGRRYGRRVVDYLGRNDARWSQRAGRAERMIRRYGVWAIVLSPLLPFGPLIYIAAGEAGMPFLLFIAADLFATLWYVGAIVAAGWFVGQPAVTVAQAVSNYSLWVILGLVLVIIAWSVWSARRATQRSND
jgi:membrane protein DedA with SNARE-associated domain